MSFGSNLRSVRISREISQLELGSILGISRQAVASYEADRREPSFKILVKIADFFNISTDYLLDRKVYKSSRNVDNIRDNIIKLILDKPLSQFSREVGLKTGILIPVEKLEMYVSGQLVPDSVTLKIFAMYSGMLVEDFYNNVK